jgi:DNA-binding GntR family transcriptional regulator
MHVGNFPEDRIAPSAPRTTLQVPSLVDALYAEIRERILTGEVPAGTPVTEMDLATQYSVARPTAKASMERLVLEGLLHRGSHKTARVPILGADDLRDLYHTRGLLEREVVMELAAQGLVPEQARKSLEQLRDSSGSSGSAGSSGSSAPSVVEVVNLDMAFHSELVGAIRSPRLSRLYRFLAGEVRLSMAQLQANHLLSASRIAQEHAAILACIERGDVDGAVASVTQHIEQACARLVAYVEAGVRTP